jgi:integrase
MAFSLHATAMFADALGTVFRFAQRQELMDANPASAVRKPKAARRVPYMLDVAEIGRLRKALDIPWQRLLVELTLTTGLRSGELRGLIWDNVDLEGGRLHIAQSVNRAGEAGATKTETSVRTVPMPAYLLPSLKRWRLGCPLSRGGYVFPGEPDSLGERGAGATVGRNGAQSGHK